LLVIWENCRLSLAAEPSGGVTIRVTEIEGLPGQTILIPIVRESAMELKDGMEQFINKTEVFTPAQMRRETASGGPDDVAA